MESAQSRSHYFKISQFVVVNW